MKAKLNLWRAPLLTLHDIGEMCGCMNIAKAGYYDGLIRPCVRIHDHTFHVLLFDKRTVERFLVRVEDGENPDTWESELTPDEHRVGRMLEKIKIRNHGKPSSIYDPNPKHYFPQ